MLKQLDNKFFVLIVVAAFLRIIAIIIYGDTEIDQEWGIMLQNLEEKNILSVRQVDGQPVPNAFMPPLYPLFLYSIKIFFQNSLYFLTFIKSIQLLFSLISIYFFYRILLEFYSKNISLIGAFLFSFFPLNVYAVSQISSITLQLFLLNIFLYSFVKIFKNKNDIKNLLIFSISSGLLILLRGEFFIFVILSLVYLFLQQQNVKNIILILLITLIAISPYVLRNYNTFGVITITKSAGYNLLKGNNPLSKVEGIGMFRIPGEIVPEVKEKLTKLESLGPIKKHDIIKDKILMDQAVQFIKNDPYRYSLLYLKKAASFVFIDIDSTYPNYYSYLNIIPKILISITTIVGIFMLIRFKINLYNYFILYYLANIGLFSFFFILPRYNLSLLSVQIIISLYLLKKLKPNL